LKEIFIIKENLTNKISYFHLLAFLATLPFDRFYSELVLISLLVHTLINFNKEKLISQRRPFFLLISLYLLTIICTIYSSDKQQAFKDCEKQLAMLLFPFIFSMTAFDVEKYRLRLLKTFAITCALTILFLYADALRIITYNKLNLSSLFSSVFMNHNFSAPIGILANYFSMYIAISIATVLYLFISSKNIYQRIGYAITAIVLSAGMLQLSSRSAIISLLIIINFVLPLFLLTGNARMKFIFISLLFTCAAIFFIIKSETFKKRFVTDLKNDLSGTNQNIALRESRMARWGCAWHLFEQSPLIGYGTGSEVSLLKEKYFEKQLYVSYLNELNTHNEYLSFMLKAGLTGLLLYLYVLATGFVNALTRKDALYFSFLIIIVTVSFSENILDANKGIFYFSFFFSFFSMPFSKLKIPGFRKETN
jgi:O-antigen ligase